MGLSANRALYSIKGIDIQSVNEVARDILSKKEPSIETIDYSKFNRANLGIDLYSSRIQPELQKQIALTQKGLYIQAIDVQKLNSSAAINLYNPRTVQKNVELTQSINQGELIAPKVLKKSDNSINLSNITDSSKENGYNPFSSGHATDEKEGKSK